MLYARPSQLRPVHQRFYELTRTTSLEKNALLLPNGQQLSFKNETEQETGSFKFRGALNSLLHLEAETFTTASAGSHGAAMARAAFLLSKSGDIYVPRTAAESKKAKIRKLGGNAIRLIEIDGTFDQARMVAEKAGDNFISPYDNLAVIAGQKTVGHEIFSQMDNAVSVVNFVPIGGGGLASGSLLSASEHPGSRVVGVTYASNRSAETGSKVLTTDDLCEGTAVNLIGEYPQDILQQHHSIFETINVSRIDVGRMIAKEILRREALTPDYGESVAFDNFPETTAFVAEAGAWKYAQTHARNDREAWVAVRTGSNSDESREQTLLDSYFEASKKGGARRTKVWHGPHTDY